MFFVFSLLTFDLGKLSGMASLNDFISAPSEELLCQLTKEQLLSLASHYDIEIASSDKRLKDSIRDALRTKSLSHRHRHQHINNL